MKSFSCKYCINSDCFIKLCSPEWIREIDKQKSQSLFKKDENIFIAGTPVLGLYFIQKGKIKVFSTGYNGRKQIVRFATDGHILGHRGLGNDVYPVGASAMENSLVCFIKNDLLEKIFLTNPKLPIELMMYYSLELRKMEERVRNIAQMNLRERTALALLLLYENFGLTKRNELNVPFTREDIADAASSTRQQVTMQISEFEMDGYIEKNGKKIVLINIDGLQKIIGKYYSYAVAV